MARTGMIAAIAALALASAAEAQMMMAPPMTGNTGRTGIFSRLRGRNATPAMTTTATMAQRYGTTQPTMAAYGTAGMNTNYGTPSMGTIVSGTPSMGTIVSGSPIIIGGQGTMIPGTIGGQGTMIGGQGTMIGGTIVAGGTTTNPITYATPAAGTYQPAMAGTTMTQQPTRGYNSYRARLLGRRNGGGAAATPYAQGIPAPGVIGGVR